MSDEITVTLTENERKFLIAMLIKTPIQVTLANISGNKTVDEMVSLVKKLQATDEEEG